MEPVFKRSTWFKRSIRHSPLNTGLTVLPTAFLDGLQSISNLLTVSSVRKLSRCSCYLGSLVESRNCLPVMLFFIDSCSNSLSKDIFPLEPSVNSSCDYWNCKFSKVLFRSTFLASRMCLKSLDHLSLRIRLIYEKFHKNLKHKYHNIIWRQ